MGYNGRWGIIEVGYCGGSGIVVVGYCGVGYCRGWVLWWLGSVRWGIMGGTDRVEKGT